MRSKRLTYDEKSLHAIYNKVLQFARKDKVVADGQFFDLMYVNPTSEKFNQNKQYVFLRKKARELLLVCANFDDKDVNVEVMIPEHAFTTLAIKEGTFNGEEIFTKEQKTFELEKDNSVELTVPANFAAVWKITL